MYTFAASDPEYRANFDFFLKFGMGGGEDIFYTFILQQVAWLIFLADEREDSSVWLDSQMVSRSKVTCDDIQGHNAEAAWL